MAATWRLLSWIGMVNTISPEHTIFIINQRPDGEWDSEVYYYDHH